MSADIEAESPTRPRIVEIAVYLILAKCVFSVIFSISLIASRSDVLDTWRRDKKHVGWSEDRLNHSFDNGIKVGIVLAVIIGLLLAYVAYRIWNGRNWARWLFTALMILPITPAADAFRITGVFFSGALLPRVIGFVTGALAIGAIFMLFSRPSASAYFKPAGGDGSPTPSVFGNLLRPRVSPRSAVEAKPAPPVAPVLAAESDAPAPVKRKRKAAAAPAAPVVEAPAKGQPPRAKSRKATTD